MRKRFASRLHLLSVRELQTAGDGDHSDGGGLLLRVRDQAATWVFRYSAATGKRREMGLGAAHRGNAAQAGDGLTSARELAASARMQLQQALDPIDERAGKRAADAAVKVAQQVERAREKLTLARAAREYHERVIEPTKTAKHAAQWLASLENHMPSAIWQGPINSITPPALLEALSAVRPHERARNLKGDRVPETLRRIRQRLDAIFEDAIFHNRCTTNPAAVIRRKLHENMPRKQAGQLAAMDFREVPAFMHRLRAADGTAARCLELAVHTAARTSEVLYATWPEFDLKAAVWILPKERMKAKEAHTVYLSDRAVEILRAQKELSLDPTIVFPSTSKKGTPMSNMAMLAVLDRLGVRGRTTVHGLCRATFSTWANETGAARPDVIEACLAHEESNRVRAAYNRAKFNDERRALLSAWADFLASAASNVVPLRAA